MRLACLSVIFVISYCLADDDLRYNEAMLIQQAEDNIKELRAAKERAEREERQSNSLAVLADEMIKDSFDSQLQSKMDILYENHTDLNKELKFVPTIFNCGKEFDIFKLLELAKAHKNVTTEASKCIEDVDDSCSNNGGSSRGSKNRSTQKNTVTPRGLAENTPQTRAVAALSARPPLNPKKSDIKASEKQVPKNVKVRPTEHARVADKTPGLVPFLKDHANLVGSQAPRIIEQNGKLIKPASATRVESSVLEGKKAEEVNSENAVPIQVLEHVTPALNQAFVEPMLQQQMSKTIVHLNQKQLMQGNNLTLDHKEIGNSTIVGGNLQSNPAVKSIFSIPSEQGVKQGAVVSGQVKTSNVTSEQGIKSAKVSEVQQTEVQGNVKPLSAVVLSQQLPPKFIAGKIIPQSNERQLSVGKSTAQLLEQQTQGTVAQQQIQAPNFKPLHPASEQQGSKPLSFSQEQPAKEVQVTEQAQKQSLTSEQPNQYKQMVKQVVFGISPSMIQEVSSTATLLPPQMTARIEANQPTINQAQLEPCCQVGDNGLQSTKAPAVEQADVLIMQPCSNVKGAVAERPPQNIPATAYFWANDADQEKLNSNVVAYRKKLGSSAIFQYDPKSEYIYYQD